MSQIRPNPLREGLREDKTAPPCSIVIFGASGDLTRRKLIPALYRLSEAGFLSAGTAIVGFARRDWDDEAFREEMRSALEQFVGTETLDRGHWERFRSHLHYCRSEFDDAQGYERLKTILSNIEHERSGGARRLYYLAIAPDYFPLVLDHLKTAALTSASADGDRWTRCIIEKPFGRDSATACALNQRVNDVFQEPQVYRIDHYLGKETVQNILVFRHANGIVDPLWNNRYIDHVQICQCETLGMEGRRGQYFDTAGITRDILQNHVLQLLTLVAMEPPVRFAADAVRDEKVKVLQAVCPMSPEDMRRRIIRAQYTSGLIGGERVRGYREEEGVAADSSTDSYVAMALEIFNWRWAGVPFFIRTGKRLPKKVTEIAIYFKKPAFALFGRKNGLETAANILTLRIQPDEGISIQFGSKAPGFDIRIDPVRMDFLYATSFGLDQQEAYERLLLDALLGDSTLFARRDEVEAAWNICTPILDWWNSGEAAPVAEYPSGSWGPPEADDMIRSFGRSWKRL